MRIRSWLFMGIGYLAGTRAGRDRFDDLKNTLQDFASSDVVTNALAQARETWSGGADEDAETDSEIRLPDEEETVDLDAEYDWEDEDEREDAGARS